jgi:hypothetical protein
MAVDERARHQLFLRVEQELGPEAAETLMSMLPPVGWADVATKDDIRLLKEDIRQLDERMNLRFDSKLNELRADFLETLVHEMHTQFRNLVVLCSSLVFAVAGLAFAAAKLT